MNRTRIDRVANAVLYEGYILYPYRPSVKSRQRWTFGGLYPAAFCRDSRGSEAAQTRTECLVRGSQLTRIEVIVRFLHLSSRQVFKQESGDRGQQEAGVRSQESGDRGQGTGIRSQESGDRGQGTGIRSQETEERCQLTSDPCILTPDSCLQISDPCLLTHDLEPVDSLRVGDRVVSTWQEAEEREVPVGELVLRDLLERSVQQRFSFDVRRWHEPLTDADGTVPGILVRDQQRLDGVVDVSAEEVAGNLFRVSVRIENLSLLEEAQASDRDAALLRSLVSAHVLLGVNGGSFISLLDPPDDCRDAAAACRNQGLWPVLVGDDGNAEAMLASPIILYDYPQVALESPGDLFDATEIDEILTLRILTLTEEEKRQVAGVDERARALLTRTEALVEEELRALHGTMQSLRPARRDADG